MQGTTAMERGTQRPNDRGPEMKIRNRLAVATVALLVALPTAAAADDVDCYADPTDPECVDDGDVLDDVEEAEQPEEEEQLADERDVEAEEVSAEVVTVSAEADAAALAETGVSATMFGLIAALLLAAGGLLLVVSRRRSPAA